MWGIFKFILILAEICCDIINIEIQWVFSLPLFKLKIIWVSPTHVESTCKLHWYSECNIIDSHLTSFDNNKNVNSLLLDRGQYEGKLLAGFNWIQALLEVYLLRKRSLVWIRIIFLRFDMLADVRWRIIINVSEEKNNQLKYIIGQVLGH